MRKNPGFHCHYPDVISLFFSCFKMLTYCYYILKKQYLLGPRNTFCTCMKWCSFSPESGPLLGTLQAPMVGSSVPNFHYVPHFGVPVNFPDQCCAFFFFPVVSGLSCGTWYLHRLIQNLSLQCRDSLDVSPGPQSTQAQQLQHMGLVAPWHMGS